jgi:hypothetical protein
MGVEQLLGAEELHHPFADVGLEGLAHISARRRVVTPIDDHVAIGMHFDRTYGKQGERVLR